MLKENYFECGFPELLVEHQRMSDNEKFLQVLSELADLLIEPVEEPKTNAGHFAMEISTLYNKDVIIIKEGIPNTGSIAFVYWKDWAKFSIIKFKKARGAYTMANYDFDVNFTKILIEKFYRILNKNYQFDY